MTNQPTRTATLYRMVMPDHTCPYGLKAKDLLRRQGYEVEDHNLTTREDDDGRWLLGPQSVSAGSLHCDVWTRPAIELAGRDTLCIKPVVGWSRTRAAREICNATRRYSLIVTLKARNSEIDLYTPISALVPVEVPVEVEIGDQI
jgi:hypothetical protein